MTRVRLPVTNPCQRRNQRFHPARRIGTVSAPQEQQGGAVGSPSDSGAEASGLCEVSGASGAEERYRESRREIAIYVAAGISLILLGIVLRSALLNWIVGPAFVVTFVVVANRWLDRRKDPRR